MWTIPEQIRKSHRVRSWPKWRMDGEEPCLNLMLVRRGIYYLTKQQTALKPAQWRLETSRWKLNHKSGTWVWYKAAHFQWRSMLTISVCLHIYSYSTQHRKHPLLPDQRHSEVLISDITRRLLQLSLIWISEVIDEQAVEVLEPKSKTHHPDFSEKRTTPILKQLHYAEQAHRVQGAHIWV